MGQISIVTIFPELVTAVVQQGLYNRVQKRGLGAFRAVNLRDFGLGKHKQVDDRPFGGGAGMVMLPEVFFQAVNSVKTQYGDGLVILTCPRGKRFTQARAKRWSKKEHLIFLCGHYEGVDERVRERLADEVISLGPFILSGGELPALMMSEAVARLWPGALSNAESHHQAAYPQYTRPADLDGMPVPEVLLSGNHSAIEAWRRKESRK